MIGVYTRLGRVHNNGEYYRLLVKQKTSDGGNQKPRASRTGAALRTDIILCYCDLPDVTVIASQ